MFCVGQKYITKRGREGVRHRSTGHCLVLGNEVDMIEINSQLVKHSALHELTWDAELIRS